MPDKSAVTELSDSVGVGALHILGLFFILDGRFGFLSFIEQYAHSEAWGIFVTVPLLVMSHVIGLLSILVAEALLLRLFGRRYSLGHLLVRVARADSEHLTTTFQDSERVQRFLAGVSLSFLTLGIGSLAEVRMMGSFGAVGYIGFVASLLAIVFCVSLTLGTRSRIEEVIRSFDESHADTKRRGERERT